MNPAHQAFFENNPYGRQLAAIVRDPGVRRAYEEFIYCGLPPVQAIVRQAEPVLRAMPEADRKFATQSIGALVGEVVKDAYIVDRKVNGTNKRARLKNARLIGTGTLFRPRDAQSADFDKAMAIARKGMKRYRNALAELAK